MLTEEPDDKEAATEEEKPVSGESHLDAATNDFAQFSENIDMELYFFAVNLI